MFTVAGGIILAVFALVVFSHVYLTIDNWYGRRVLRKEKEAKEKALYSYPPNSHPYINPHNPRY